ncbi:Na+/H+ antiporter NhaA [Brachybacterium alimentarium]|uniref:Na+/H+ antiporter NhaA n=1 Tax=Brachybacterium alimentarium TaxID=47845 RepID=UPI000BB849F0|nr:Na+/H+ antiporter NhaA [Brachybacterium alimentarium]PCC33636.1 Na+/H+ antiporter NhaA [Brachybacterium alimentarium]RCS75157.1 Na+/H+ antiporter NhaA [Brachybacterium alimentarium]RCS79321.1 Na+/H+ antiporter NhaA [Brachybacterium alimentarium]RCS88234.1 Na+/H+ antiporter NhaA [Brachybacterium alimentarium]
MSTRATLEHGTYREHSRLEEIVVRAVPGGALLLIATILSLIMSNSGLSELYSTVRDAHVGFTLGPLNLDLTIGHWAADGLLAVFFFLAGLELKQEFVVGDLRSPSQALVPVAAAFGGVAVPALLYTLINLGGPEGAGGGWAIPAATDIAFAVAILALLGSSLPTALRTFLLTLAIVDDLVAITIIAIFYTSDLRLGFLALAVIPVALFWLLTNKAEALFKKHYWTAWVLLLPLAVITWVLFLNSGVHATIAGVVLAFMVPTRGLSPYGKQHSLSHTLEHRLRPFSSAIAVPVFAFFSAGVAVGGLTGLLDAWQSTVALGIIVGLVGGKILGIVGTSFVLTKLTSARLDPSLRWPDMLGMAAVAGIGFTVSLLVSELSFTAGDPMYDAAKVGVLTASALAAVLGAAILVPRNAMHRREQAAEGAAGASDSTKVTEADG